MRVSLGSVRADGDAKRQCEKVDGTTNKNLCFLREYGKALLSRKTDYDDLSTLIDAEFKKRGTKNPLPLSTYSISPKVGGTCFNDDYPVAAENFWNDQVEPVRKQIEHVAEFLYQYHVDVDGTDPVVFGIKNVELCPLTVTNERKMIVNGTTLTIGLPVYGVISTYYGWYSFTELRRAWDRGDFFEKTYSVKSVATSILVGDEVPMIWKIANPVGMVRTSARQFMRAKGGELKELLGKLKGSVEGKAGDQDFNLAKQVLNLGVDNVESQIIPAVLTKDGPAAKNFFDQGKAKGFLDEWNCHLDRLSQQSTVSNAAIGGLMEHNDDSEVKYDIKAQWVAVANFHDINVDFLTSYSNHKNFIEVPKKSERKHKFTVNASGKVVVVTDDRININAALSYLAASTERTLQSESFHEAVRTFALPANFRCVVAL